MKLNNEKQVPKNKKAPHRKKLRHGTPQNQVDIKYPKGIDYRLKLIPIEILMFALFTGRNCGVILTN